MPKIEEDGKSWLRRPKLYKGVVEPCKKKKYTVYLLLVNSVDSKEHLNELFP